MRNCRRFATALAVMTTAALVVGCGSNGAGPAGGAKPGVEELTIMTPEPTSTVDKVTWNVRSGEPGTLNPFMSANFSPNVMVSNMCETLLHWEPDGSIEPNLAESVSNPDPLHWVYDLRADVEFWDGKPMTAEDVAWSLNHNLTDSASLYHSNFSNVKSIEETGPNQVTVTLKRPDYLFNDQLVNFTGVVVQKAFYEENAKTYGSPTTGVMCTGPFKLEDWAQGSSITLAKNPNYWNPDLQPKVNQLVFTFLAETNAITAALSTGEVDGSYRLPESAVGELRDSPVGTLYFGPAPISGTIYYVNRDGAMMNPKLREALQMAIDWKGIATTVYGGTGTPIRGPIPPAVFGAANDILQPAYDKLPEVQSAQYEKARQLVQEAGADAQARIVIVTPPSETSAQFGVAVENAAKQIGLTNFKLKVVPSIQFGNYLFDAKVREANHVDIMYITNSAATPNPLDWILSTAVTGGTFNNIGYTAVDDLYAKAVGTTDADKRAEIIAQIQAKLREDLLPMVPGVGLNNILWMNKRITGAPAAFNYMYYPWAAHLGGTE